MVGLAHTVEALKALDVVARHPIRLDDETVVADILQPICADAKRQRIADQHSDVGAVAEGTDFGFLAGSRITAINSYAAEMGKFGPLPSSDADLFSALWRWRGEQGHAGKLMEILDQAGHGQFQDAIIPLGLEQQFKLFLAQKAAREWQE